MSIVGVLSRSGALLGSPERKCLRTDPTAKSAGSLEELVFRVLQKLGTKCSRLSTLHVNGPLPGVITTSKAGVNYSFMCSSWPLS